MWIGLIFLLIVAAFAFGKGGRTNNGILVLEDCSGIEAVEVPVAYEAFAKALKNAAQELGCREIETRDDLEQLIANAMSRVVPDCVFPPADPDAFKFRWEDQVQTWRERIDMLWTAFQGGAFPANLCVAEPAQAGFVQKQKAKQVKVGQIG